MKHCASRKRRLVLFCGWILLTSFAKSNLTGKHCSIGVEARENSQRTVTILRTRSPRRRWTMPAWLCDGKKKVVKLVQVVAWLRSVIFDESWNRLSAKGYCLNRFWNPRVYIHYIYCIYYLVDCVRLFLLDTRLNRLSIKYVEFLSSGCRDLRTVDGSDSPLPWHLRCFRWSCCCCAWCRSSWNQDLALQLDYRCHVA